MVPDKFAGFVLGKNGSRIQKTASKSGCKASGACSWSLSGGLDDLEEWHPRSARHRHRELQAIWVELRGCEAGLGVHVSGAGLISNLRQCKIAQQIVHEQLSPLGAETCDMQVRRPDHRKRKMLEAQT